MTIVSWGWREGFLGRGVEEFAVLLGVGGGCKAAFAAAALELMANRVVNGGGVESSSSEGPGVGVAVAGDGVGAGKGGASGSRAKPTLPEVGLEAEGVFKIVLGDFLETWSVGPEPVKRKSVMELVFTDFWGDPLCLAVVWSLGVRIRV